MPFGLNRLLAVGQTETLTACTESARQILQCITGLFFSDRAHCETMELHLKPAHIDSSRMVIRVEQGKVLIPTM